MLNRCGGPAGMLAYRYPGIEAARVGRFKQVLKELLLPEAAQRIGGPWGRSFAELEQELTGPNFDWSVVHGPKPFLLDSPCIGGCTLKMQ